MHTQEPTTFLKRDSLGRVTVGEAQREALLDEFERSGMKGVPFARLVGVNYQTFATWVQKRRRACGAYPTLAQSRVNGSTLAATPKQPLRLMEAVMTAAPTQTQPVTELSSRRGGLEIVLPSGVTMLIGDAEQVALAAQLIHALRAPC